MVRPQTLRSGSVSAAGLRAWTVVLAALAVLLRLSTHLASGRAVPEAAAPPATFALSPDFVWSSPPLPALILSLAHATPWAATVLIGLELLAVVLVVALLVRIGERWLDYRVGLLAAAAWAFCGPAVAVFRVPGSEGWQAALSILCAAAMLRVARRRAPVEAWRIGASAGLLSLFSGGGTVWAVAAAAWLPVTSRKFRGRNWFALAGLILAGWVVVVLPVVVRNAVVTGGEVVLPMADDAARFAVAMRDPDLDAGGRPGDLQAAGAVLDRHGLSSADPAWTRSFRLALDGLAAGPSAWWAVARRGIALVGGWLPRDVAPAWTLPWWVLVVLAWGGTVALVPGTRFLFPLLLGGLVALARGMLYGVDPGTAVAATPFVCLYAAYGIWRGATGWRSAITWAVLPPVLLVALLVHLAVRGWG